MESVVLSCEKVGQGFHVRLLHSLFYPEGGGQPADRGWIGRVPVEDVQNANGPVHMTTRPVPVGPTRLELDWRRRFDHMQQHSGQHLLTAVILKHFGWKTVGFHLGARTTTIDLETEGVDPAQLSAIEGWVNEAIIEARPIHSRWVSRGDLQRLGVRTRGVPDTVTGPIRLIEIEGIDLNTCGGTHIENTHQLQLFKALSVERVSGHTRLHFHYGSRILEELEALRTNSLALNRVFDQGAEYHLGIANKWATDLREQKRSIKRLSGELARSLGQGLADGNGSVVSLLRQEEDLSFLSLILSEACRLRPDGCYVLGGGAKEGVFLIYAPGVQLGRIRGRLLECIEGRGGGKPPRIQGKCKRLDRMDVLCQLLSQAC
jgi:Ser-tRNA(Ala) deacylase AlaX